MSGQPQIDYDRLNELSELLSAEGNQVFAGLVRMFLQHLDKGIVDVARALHEQNSQALIASAHKLKGSACNLGITGVADYCVQLENSARDFSQVDQLYQELCQEAQTVQELLQRRFLASSST